MIESEITDDVCLHLRSHCIAHVDDEWDEGREENVLLECGFEGADDACSKEASKEPQKEPRYAVLEGREEGGFKKRIRECMGMPDACQAQEVFMRFLMDLNPA